LVSLADTDSTQIHYRAWQACVTQQQRIQQLNQRVLDAATQNTRLQESVEHTQKRLDSAWQHAQTIEADHARALQAAQHAAQTQLQQVQQELARQQQEHNAALAAKTDLQTKTKQLTDAQSKLKQQEQAAQKTKNQITELQQESELLLNQLHKVQEELERYYLENQKLKANQKPKAKTYYGAADRIKGELPYRLGACLIKQSRSLGGWFALPFALRTEVKRFHQSATSDARKKLPPIDQYNDAHEAERIKNHLSYRLGACMLNHSKTLGGWLTMPWALYAENKTFQQARGNKAA